MAPPWTLLPAAPLSEGTLSAAFVKHGCADFREAARLLQELPYGRPAQPGRYLAVLSEGRGTCSSKHALAALLAEELVLDVQLTLACFEMSEANTPGVGDVLKRHGLDAILEAHCYLRFEGKTVDLTWPVLADSTGIVYSHERPISPTQLAEDKPRYHRRKLGAWGEQLALPFSLDQLWAIREACIAALHSPSCAPGR